MDSASLIINQLYTSFLLRDVFGKIVPGCVVLFSVAVLFNQQREVWKFILQKEHSAAFLLLIAGVAWTITLGHQGVASRISHSEWAESSEFLKNLWRYYPAEVEEIRAQADVQDFLKKACRPDIMQYERFVVIKEAAGNMFIAIIISFSILLCARYSQMKRLALSNKMQAVGTTIIFSLSAFGLHLMNVEHVKKQYDFVMASDAHKNGAKCVDSPSVDNKKAAEDK